MIVERFTARSDDGLTFECIAVVRYAWIGADIAAWREAPTEYETAGGLALQPAADGSFLVIQTGQILWPVR